MPTSPCIHLLRKTAYERSKFMPSSHNRNYFEKASMYKMLADYYQYSNPDLHDYYYKKHVNNLQKILSSQRSENSLNTTITPAKVRIFHAAPDAPNVDVYINGTRILKDFSYKEATDYLTLPPGKYQIDVYPTGNMTTTVISRKVQVGSGKLYTMAIAGIAKNLRLIPHEDFPYVPQGEAKIRFINLSPDTAQVDFAVKNSDIVFPNVSFRKNTDYINVTPMQVDFEIRTAGTKEIALSLPDVTLQPNTTYTVYLIGLSDGTPPLEGLILIP